MALAMGDEDVVYLDGKTTRDVAGDGVDVVAFTRSRVIRATCSPGGEDLRVWTLPRISLKRVEFRGGTSLFTQPQFENWPGEWALDLTYPEEVIAVPVSDTAGDETFLALATTLLDDLAKSS